MAPGLLPLKLVGNGGQQQYVPLTVRDDASTAAFVFQNSVTTWQAYNLYGDYSLYYGPTGRGGQDFANRARVVSFDRPYPQSWASGAADFVGNEFPLLYHLESLGLDVTYWTDVDLHADPSSWPTTAASSAWATTSTGPARCATAPRRPSSQRQQPGLPRGQRLLPPDPPGADLGRAQPAAGLLQGAAEDPMAQQDPALTTVNWNQAPVDDPESHPDRLDVPVGRAPTPTWW